MSQYVPPTIVKKKKTAIVPGRAYPAVPGQSSSNSDDDPVRNGGKEQEPSTNDEKREPPMNSDSDDEGSKKDDKEKSPDEHLSDHEQVPHEASRSNDSEVSHDSPDTQVLALLAAESDLAIHSLGLIRERKEVYEQISTLLVKQNECCDAEDYDQADRIDTEISKLRSFLFDLNQKLLVDNTERKTQIWTNLEQALTLWLEQTRGQRVHRQAALEGETRALQQRKLVLEKTLVKSKKIDQNFVHDELKCKERMDSYLTQQSALSATMEGESREIEAVKAVAVEDHKRWETEVVELQAKLAEAMEKRSECARNISSAEMQLGRIESQFADELQQLEIQHNELIEAETNLLKTKTNLGGGITKSTETEISLTIEKLEQIRIQSEEDISNEKTTEIETFLDHRKLIHIQLTEIAQPLSLVQAEFIQAASLVRLLAEALKTSETELGNFKAKSGSFKSKLAELEFSKKEAISSRAFREAKEISDEIKSLTDQMEGSEAALALLRSAVSQARCDWLAAVRTEEETLAKLEKIEAETKNREDEFWSSVEEFPTLPVVKVAQLEEISGVDPAVDQSDPIVDHSIPIVVQSEEISIADHSEDILVVDSEKIPAVNPAVGHSEEIVDHSAPVVDSEEIVETDQKYVGTDADEVEAKTDADKIEIDLARHASES